MKAWVNQIFWKYNDAVMPCLSVVTSHTEMFGYLFKSLPTGFLPYEDQGAFMVDLRLPDGASLNRTELVLTEVENELSEIAGVTDVMSVAGFSMLSGSMSPNAAFIIGILDHWDNRQTPELSLRTIFCLDRFSGATPESKAKE